MKWFCSEAHHYNPSQRALPNHHFLISSFPCFTTTETQIWNDDYVYKMECTGLRMYFSSTGLALNIWGILDLISGIIKKNKNQNQKLNSPSHLSYAAISAVIYTQNLAESYYMNRRKIQDQRLHYLQLCFDYITFLSFSVPVIWMTENNTIMTIPYHTHRKSPIPYCSFNLYRSPLLFILPYYLLLRHTCLSCILILQISSSKA